MAKKVLIIITFLGQIINQRDKISIFVLTIKLRQHHLRLSHLHMHQMRIQRKINLVIMDEGLLNAILDLFGSVTRIIGFDFQISLPSNIF